LNTRIGYILISVATALAALFCLGFVVTALAGPAKAVTTNPPKIDPAIAQYMTTVADPAAPIRFIVYLNPTAKLSDDQSPNSKLVRRVEVIQQLQHAADTSQQPVRRLLDKLTADGTVQAYQPLWIVNAIAVTGNTAALESIVQQPNVARIMLDEQRGYFDQRPSLISDSAAISTGFITGLAANATEENWGIKRVRAAHAWHGLGINGEGVTVAIMDTGVDWQHPDLLTNYRGNLGGGAADHNGNWFHAATPSLTIPIDLHGHGTHVAGTAVGQNGIGVAPGAKWIAVAIADANGLIFDSAVHAAFQWLLAPAGNPALAPDVVNNSWGLSGDNPIFYPDVRALQAAGIVPVFAAGNNGPLPNSVNAPASYTNTLSVGASDDGEAVTWFSSRGPSPLTAEPKPQLVAPGTRILSAYPGTAYQLFNGTSMATPHVAGTLALMMQANPALTQQRAADLLANSAVPLSSTIPNDNDGWGRLDAYAAVVEAANSDPFVDRRPGLVQGVVSAAEDGRPLANATITITTPSGQLLTFNTDTNGQYHAWLQPGTYDLEAALFGYRPASSDRLTVRNGETIVSPITLEKTPAGTVSGAIRQAGDGRPLAATLEIGGAQIRVIVGADGIFSVSLPGGAYKLTARIPGYRLTQRNAVVRAGEVTSIDFVMEKGPSVLLVDSGQWYYDSYLPYYEEALVDNRLYYDVQRIRDPLIDLPGSSAMAAYDAVIWSSPIDSPGYIGANNVITDYLGTGGRMLISGRDVGNLDGSAAGLEWWWQHDLRGRYVGESPSNPATIKVTGVGQTFDGLELNLNGANSADNQVAPDQSQPQAGSLTRPILSYADGTSAGLLAGHCTPYRLAYLGFGLEGVSGKKDRADLLQRLFSEMFAPRISSGAQMAPAMIDDFALPDESLVYTLTIRNLSETLTDTFRFTTADGAWTSSLVTPTLTIGPCETAETVLRLNVPPNAAPDTHHQLQLVAASSLTGAKATVDIHHKTPGHILLVDDDRFFNEETTYTAALDSLGLRYDVWETGWGNSARRSPSAALLQAYDLVIWYTGYDWFRPVTQAENEALLRYLESGGRLFLSSQDFLYYNYESSPLAQRYFGVFSYTESLTSSLLYGNEALALSSRLSGPVPLQFGGYQNFSDGLIPAPGVLPFAWGNQGMAVGTANSNAAEGWRTVFWSTPWEKMDKAARQDTMNGIVGWLSDLGDSTWTAERRVVQPGEMNTYTVTLRAMDEVEPFPVVITNTLPEGLEIRPRSIRGGAEYNVQTRQLTWAGTIAPGEERRIIYEARVVGNPSPTTPLENTVTLFEGRHRLTFEKTAAVWINAPDLSRSSLHITADSRPMETDPPTHWRILTYTLRVENSGLTTAHPATATLHLPNQLFPLTSTLRATGGTAVLEKDQVAWRGTLEPGEAVSVTLTLTQTLRFGVWLPSTAVLSDGVTTVLVRDGLYYPATYRQYFPLFVR
jgi:uncharacterized repeat protein (TIGR01451 family)